MKTKLFYVIIILLFFSPHAFGGSQEEKIKSMQQEIESLKLEIESLKSNLETLQKKTAPNYTDWKCNIKQLVIKLDYPKLITDTSKNIFEINGAITVVNRIISGAELKNCGIVLYPYGYVYGDTAYRGRHMLTIDDKGSFSGSLALTPGYRTKIFVRALKQRTNERVDSYNSHDVM